jgi:hypothetical protein
MRSLINTNVSKEILFPSSGQTERRGRVGNMSLYPGCQVLSLNPPPQIGYTLLLRYYSQVLRHYYYRDCFLMYSLQAYPILLKMEANNSFETPVTT